jgi:cytochrome b subunit of formate dehydrogenase
VSKQNESTFERVPLNCLLLLFAAAFGAGAAPNETCIACHDKVKQPASSVHATVACASCHAKRDDYPHPADAPKPACTSCHDGVRQAYAGSVHAQEKGKGNAMAPDCGVCHGTAHEAVSPRSADFRKSVPDTCGGCHDKVADEFKNSVHGAALAKGVTSAPVCTDCHGEHAILKPGNSASSVNVNHLRDTCGQCHGNVNLARRFGLPADRITTFDASFHGLALKEGTETVASCASCHGIHNILKSSDPKSMTYAKNLPSTCGKCHPGAGTRFALGPIHDALGAREPFAVVIVRIFYLLAIPGTIGLMLLHNAGDWFRKMLARRFGPHPSLPPASRGAHRMYPFERINHGLLMLSFFVLAWTGFALKYPDQWWARPMHGLNGLRRNIHRGAAIVFLVAAIMHIASLIWNKKLRNHWKVLLPKRRDIPDAMRMTMFNIGLAKRKPVIPPHSYMEKLEYWAVLWGGIVMLVSGALLWANSLAMRFLPKAVLDVCTAVHWYEAILATLAIVAWHLYAVIFDPDVYPLDTAFITGRTVRQRAEEEEEPSPAHGD